MSPIDVDLLATLPRSIKGQSILTKNPNYSKSCENSYILALDFLASTGCKYYPTNTNPEVCERTILTLLRRWFRWEFSIAHSFGRVLPKHPQQHGLETFDAEPLRRQCHVKRSLSVLAPFVSELTRVFKVAFTMVNS